MASHGLSVSQAADMESDCRAGNQGSWDKAHFICLPFCMSEQLEMKWKEIWDKKKVKFEVTNTEDQILLFVFIHFIPSSDLSPLTLLFLVYICTHTYKILYFFSSSIKIVIPLRLIWEEHETDIITKSHYVAGGLQLVIFSSRKPEISRGRRDHSAKRNSSRSYSAKNILFFFFLNPGWSIKPLSLELQKMLWLEHLVEGRNRHLQGFPMNWFTEYIHWRSPARLTVHLHGFIKLETGK